jgi:hypothetical protein
LNSWFGQSRGGPPIPEFEDLRGLLAFKEGYPTLKLFLFYGGAKRYTEKGITFVPLREAMSDIRDFLS